MSFVPLLALVFLLIASTANASPMSNEDVASMLRAGMSEATVIQAIEASDGLFDTSANGLIGLKKAGATDAVLQKVIAKSAPKSQAQGATASTGGVVPCVDNSPDSVPTATIRVGENEQYIPQEKGSVDGSLNPLSMLGSALTFGGISAKGRTAIVLPGARAQIRVTSRKPTFLPHFPLSFKPSEYSKYFNIARLKRADDSRVFMDAPFSANPLSGKYKTPNAQDTLQASLVPAVYRADLPNCSYKGTEMARVIVEPETDLEPGEYAILTSNKDGFLFYPFGVD